MAVLRIFLATAATACAVLAAGINPTFEVATVRPSGSDITTRHFTIEGRRFLTFHTSNLPMACIRVSLSVVQAGLSRVSST